MSITQFINSPDNKLQTEILNIIYIKHPTSIYRQGDARKCQVHRDPRNVEIEYSCRSQYQKLVSII